MRSDKYLKIILTIIAICLVWICIRDIKIEPKNLYASDRSVGRQEVYIRRIDALAFTLCEPIRVKVIN